MVKPPKGLSRTLIELKNPISTSHLNSEGRYGKNNSQNWGKNLDTFPFQEKILDHGYVTYSLHIHAKILTLNEKIILNHFISQSFGREL